MIHKNLSYTELTRLLTMKDSRFDDLYKMVLYIEKILCDIIDVTTKQALSNINNDLDVSNIKYTLLGGKAINNFLRLEYVNKSFDFDIHILDNNSDKIDQFGTKIEKALNDIFNNKIKRNFLYILLKNNDLVTDSDEQYYLGDEKLFYYGIREKRNLSIKGLFIKLRLKDLFVEEFIDNNINELISSSDYISTKKYKSDNNYNIIYYPIMDIELEENLNYGVQNTNSTIYKSDYDQLFYPKLPIILFNLNKYLESITNQYKKDKLINRITNLNNLDKYNCLVSNNNFIENFININLNDINDLYKSEINNITTKLLSIFRNSDDLYRKCIDELIIGGPENINLIKDIVLDKNVEYNKLSEIIKAGDISNVIKTYTQHNYIEINFNLFNKHFFPTTVIPQDVQNQINLIDNIFNTLRLSDDKYNIYSINDTFDVYRLQSFICINSPEGDLFNLSTVGIGDILYNPNYLSTSYSNYFSYEDFYSPFSFVLNIKIKKINKNWLFIGPYSFYPTEKELLINKGSYLRIINIGYKSIKHNNIIRDILVITAELYDNINDLITIIPEYIPATTESTINLYNFTDSDISIIKTKKNNNFIDHKLYDITDDIKNKKYIKLSDMTDIYFKKYNDYLDRYNILDDKLFYNRGPGSNKYLNYKNKYLKYKNKYLKLKEDMNL